MLTGLVLFVLSANPYLSQARAAVQALRYDEAVRLLRIAREVPDATMLERREVDDLLARALAALGKGQEAEQVYGELLTRDPHAPSPADAAPKIRAAYLAAKTRLYPKPHVRLQVLGTRPDGTELELVDPWGQVASVEAKGKPLAVEQHRLLAPHGLEVLAFDDAGIELAHAGPFEAPAAATLVPKPPTKPEPFVEAPVSADKTWSRVGLGTAAAGVVAIGVGVVLAVTSAGTAQASRDAARADDSYKLYEQARGEAVAANVLIGSGGALGVGGLLLWAFSP